MRTADMLLLPVMWILGGLRRANVQRTHAWHRGPIEGTAVNDTLGVAVAGDDPSSRVTNSVVPFPFFHAPIFGGWRNYVVLSVPEGAEPWRLGWIHRQWPTGARPKSCVHRVPINGQLVRALSQPFGYETLFFALSLSGKQLPLVVTDRGVLGDGRYARVPLY